VAASRFSCAMDENGSRPVRALEAELPLDERARPELIAYYRPPLPATRIEPASRWRDWMNATTERYANRCLPLLMANEAGWVLLNAHRFEATWSGDDHAAGLTIDYGAAPPPPNERSDSTFGYGIFTFRIPYLLRTPPGWNLLARGPANWPRDGVAALEGLVETDWSVATFTMNWKLTRPGTVVFDAGDPICMVVPQRRGELESFRPLLRGAESDPGADSGWQAFRNSRHELQVKKFIAEYLPGRDADRQAWESDYFRGRVPGGEAAAVHQTKLRLAAFEDAETAG